MDYYFPDLINMAIMPRGGEYVIFLGFYTVLVVNRDRKVARELHSRIRS